LAGLVRREGREVTGRGGDRAAALGRLGSGVEKKKGKVKDRYGEPERGGVNGSR
jgi:hypothetical protein